jgi:hypothetical protein
MRQSINLGHVNNSGLQCKWFNANLLTNFIPIQDPIHIGTKLRNRLLNTNLKFGKNTISPSFLSKLVDTLPKSDHRLCLSNINVLDRQNFDSVLRICSDDVITLLSSHIKDSQGTVFYLRIVSNVIKTFLDLRLKPLERVRLIWISNFLLRIWRQYILEHSKHYNMKEHFVTNNCYACVEINAHSIIFVMNYLRDRILDNYFHPDLLGSQPCEGIFRQVRSFSSTYSTVTNSSVLEMIDKISKIQLMSDIAHIKLKDFEFPSVGLPNSSYYPMIDRNGENIAVAHPLPSMGEISREVELARLEAIEYAESLGVVLKTAEDLQCKIPLNEKNCKKGNNEREMTPFQNNERDKDIVETFKNTNLKQYSEKNVNVDKLCETSSIVKIKNLNGEEFFIKKYILCWLLSKTTSKLSSDRLSRVMGKKH